jgi:thiamine biosynthesis protein ThiS
MRLIVNGTSQECTEKAPTLETWLAARGFAPGTVLVERNGVALFPREFSTTLLSDGDQLELVKIAAGG